MEEMDALVDEAAALPRRYGFAPKNEEMYSSDSQRKAARYVKGCLHDVVSY
jgi:uncharacterized protein YqcC (DUF446 family)